jgi:hypothetical protein
MKDNAAKLHFSEKWITEWLYVHVKVYDKEMGRQIFVANFYHKNFIGNRKYWVIFLII